MSTNGYNNIRIGPTKTEGQLKALSARTYRGFSTVAGNIRSTVLYDLELIKQDIINHFHIRKGEKLENPTFGTIIWDVLFDPLTDQLRELIVNDVTDIVNTDPRVRVTNAIVTQFEQGLQVEVSLIYVPYNIQETMQFTFDAQNNII
jgi:phage baseplate assembly protein W